MSIPTADLAEIESRLIAAVESPEVKALVLNLLKTVAATVESKTGNPFLRSMEEGAFALVQGYLSPAPVVPSPADPALPSE